MKRRLLGVLIVASIAVACLSFSAATLAAKHEQPVDSTNEETPDAAPPGDIEKGASTVIIWEVVESHDRFSDADGSSEPIVSGIEWSHKFTAALSGRNHVAEKWTNIRVSPGGAIAAGRMKKSNRSSPSNEQENVATIGAKSSTAEWHVLGPNKLQRLFAGQHFLMVMNIEIGGDKSCHLEVRYLRQEGFTSVVMGDASKGEAAFYSLPRVQSASCSIRSP
jgi:hypothetical protein